MEEELEVKPSGNTFNQSMYLYYSVVDYFNFI